jgi:hypothetical protein
MNLREVNRILADTLNKIWEVSGSTRMVEDFGQRLKAFSKQNPLYRALESAIDTEDSPGGRFGVPVKKSPSFGAVSHQEARQLIAKRYATRGVNSDFRGVMYFIDLTEKGRNAYYVMKKELLSL